MSGNEYAGNGSGNQDYLSPVPPWNEPAAHGGQSLDSGCTAQTSALLASGASPLTLAPIPDIGSPTYSCHLCPGSPKFATPQDLKRHIKTFQAHRTKGTRFYRCSCGRYDVSRKDNYLRHIGTCRSPAKIPYTCMCNKFSLVRHEHKEHVKGCGRSRQPQKRRAQ
ncbi:hypothetical protein F4678DRAFT_451941 [Xylaria arbuscula]|nr:hypothetical protein F4678DRAFT_451941 [Xylaria arbuscula]